MTQNRWFSCSTRRKSPKLRLFCLPHAGGGTALYHRWTPFLPQSIELIALKLPGREDRLDEKPYEELDQLAGELVRPLEPLVAEPYAVFGHSLGAAIGYRLALALREASLPAPETLIVSACQSPELWRTAETLHTLPDAEMIAQLAYRFGPRQEASENELALMKIMAKTIRADLKMLETFRHDDAPPLDCPIFALGGTDDPQVTRAKLQGWQNMTNRAFGVRFFPGGHFYLRDQPRAVVQTILSRLAGFLD